MKNEYNETISLETIKFIYTEIWSVFSKYYNIVYQSEILGDKNANKKFSVDESLFTSNENHDDI